MVDVRGAALGETSSARAIVAHPRWSTEALGGGFRLQREGSSAEAARRLIYFDTGMSNAFFFSSTSLLQIGKYCVRYDREASLESMCEPLRPGRDGSALGFGLPFTPVKALMAANFKEYTKIALTVSVSIL